MYRTHSLRKGRFSEEGRVYLVTITTERRHRRFHDRARAEPVVAAIRAADAEAHTATEAWVVMPDHLHWLFSLGDVALSTVVARLKSRSTVVINRQCPANGRVWQKGYHDRAFRDERSVQAAARYIIANPLRAGLVAQVEDWPMWEARGLRDAQAWP